jgi:hypothetical protein
MFGKFFRGIRFGELEILIGLLEFSESPIECVETLNKMVMAAYGNMSAWQRKNSN